MYDLAANETKNPISAEWEWIISGFICFRNLKASALKITSDTSLRIVILSRSAGLSLNPNLKIFEVSCKTGEGLAGWTEWLRSLVT